ncbi:hypothetical protein ACF1GP_32825, partial [Kitasatospora aureofaciens]
FTSGTTTATAVTNALGVATGSLTFSTAGPATVTATVTATGTPCACTGVVSVPITVTVTGTVGSGTTLTAAPACWRVNLPLPLPDVFKATLTATLSPAQAGVTVSFFVANQLVGTAVTDATGTATLQAGLNPLQIPAGSYTAQATVGATTLHATNSLTPCLPPV